MQEITLRTHHVICIQSFIGKGYSNKFIENLSNIINYLKLNNNQKCIKLSNNCDDICKCCPNKLHSNTCRKEEFIKHLDESYKQICNFDYNTQYSLEELNNIIKNNLTIDKFKNVCGNCEWFFICSKLIKNII